MLLGRGSAPLCGLKRPEDLGGRDLDWRYGDHHPKGSLRKRRAIVRHHSFKWGDALAHAADVRDVWAQEKRDISTQRERNPGQPWGVVDAA